MVPIGIVYAENFALPGQNLTDTITDANAGDIINLLPGEYAARSITKDLIFNGSGTDTILRGEWQLRADITIANLTAANSTGHAFTTRTNDNFIFDNLIIENASSHGILIFNQDFSDASVSVLNTNFKNIGLVSSSHPADMKFFEFNGTARIENVTIIKPIHDTISLDPDDKIDTNNDNVFGIEFRGLACDTNSDHILVPESGVLPVLMKNVTISGSPNKHALLIQCYSDVSNFTLEDVDLSGVTGDPKSIYPTSVLIAHNGTIPFDLGNTKLRDIMVTQTGDVNATRAEFVGTSDNFAIENVVNHGLDSFGLNTFETKPNQGLDSPFHIVNTRLGGIVTWVKDQFFVPENTGDVQLAFDRAGANTTVNIEGFVVESTNNTNTVKLDSDTNLVLTSSVQPIETPIVIDLQIPVTVEKEVLISFPNEQPIEITNDDAPNVKITIPDNTLIQAPDAWNGEIEPPTIQPQTGTAPSGFIVADRVIEVGSADHDLVLNATALIELLGVTGIVGYSPSSSNNWFQITDTCPGSFTAPGDPVRPGECFISNGVDTKIVTFHLTQFGGLSAAPSTTTAATPSETSSNKGGSGKTGVGPSGPSKSVSISSVKQWAADESTFRVAVNHLVVNGLIDADEPRVKGEVEQWILFIGETWDKNLIPDQHFYDAMKYLLDNRILR